MAVPPGTHSELSARQSCTVNPALNKQWWCHAETMGFPDKHWAERRLRAEVLPLWRQLETLSRGFSYLGLNCHLSSFKMCLGQKNKRADVCQSVMLVTDTKTARLRPEQFFRICGQPRTPRLIVPNREKEPKAWSLVLQISEKQNFIIPESTYQLTNYLE